jgi:N-acetyl-gamma-glutamyl-phosphate reductase
MAHQLLILAAAATALVAPTQRRAPRAAALQAKKTVFIDGEAGTTGLQVLDRLATHPDIEVLSIDPAKRKDADARKEAIAKADAVVLCLPDDAAREAVALAEGTDTKIVDASTAHRIDDAWVYGFPELDAAQRSKIASSTRVANPGCYATGFIAVTRPLVDAGLLKPEARLACSAVSGYSGGGKQLTAVFEEQAHEPWGAYGWNLDHKHLPEMAFHGRLEEPPVFLPAVGAFAQGMVISVPVVYGRDCSGVSKGDQLHAALQAHYAGSNFVKVMPRGLSGATDANLLERGAFLEPEKLNGSNGLELFVFDNDARGTACLVARLDNLGKGASGAAVQNLNIMLGLGEDLGLQL